MCFYGKDDPLSGLTSVSPVSTYLHSISTECWVRTLRAADPRSSRQLPGGHWSPDTEPPPADKEDTGEIRSFLQPLENL